MKLKQYNILLIAPLMFLSVLLSPNNYDFGTTARENQVIQAELTKTIIELEESKRETIRLKKVMVIYEHYRNSGTLYTRTVDGKTIRGCDWITFKYLYSVVLWEEKYHHLAKGFNWDTLEPENFDLCWIVQESNFNPRQDFIIKNKTGTLDFWVMQMNQVHYYEKDPKKNLWRRVEVLYPELKNKPDWSPEKNMAVWHLWKGEDKKWGCWKIWESYRKEVRELFFKLRKIK